MTRRRLFLSVHGAGRGGAELLALLEARSLAEEYDLTIAVPPGRLRADFAELGPTIDGTPSLPLWGDSPRRWAAAALRTLPSALRIRRAVAESGAAAVLVNSSVSLAPVIGARLAGVPVVVHARDVPESRLSPLVFALHGALADRIVIIAAAMRPHFRRVRRARLVPILEGIDVGPEPAERGPGERGSELAICLVGGIDPRKGQDVAVEALALLAGRGLPARLELIGREVDPRFAAAVRARARALGVDGLVEEAGEIADVRSALLRADVVISPSRNEWTPLSLMEAMACARPVVASAVGGVAEVVGEAGLLVPPSDHEALADALDRLARDPELARRLGREGRRRVVDRFTIERSLAEKRRLVDGLFPPAPQPRAPATAARRRPLRRSGNTRRASVTRSDQPAGKSRRSTSA
jgi:glycosyltransferase involved in cell wall biosynthesis